MFPHLRAVKWAIKQSLLRTPNLAYELPFQIGHHLNYIREEGGKVILATKMNQLMLSKLV